MGIMRLNKFVAHCGICSRRKAAELVKQGHVRVNKEVETNPAYEVQPKDKIYYKGKRITAESKKVYLLMNKPKDVITTVSDDRGRRTVMDLIKHKVNERVYPVGRLDRKTTGLLLLTNDGDLAKQLSHPSYQVKKIYHVILDRVVKPSDIDKILRGIELEDGVAEVDEASYIRDAKKNEIGIELHSGKNRIIRRIFEELSYKVTKLDRVYYAGLTKKDLKRGWFRNLTPQEVIMLRHFIGKK